MIMLGDLGQDESLVVTDPYMTVGTLWDNIDQYCQTQATPAQCRALLGYRPIYFPPTVSAKPILPFWVLLLLGYIAGKHNIL